ncbi:helix-turn-helix domain-containing protein [Micromonospora sp. LOL_021]|uniref:helix-turn-helix domain-containing protein n=1 Tax=Micromonospora sp. LOL_021 TaxID=3345417 RepID=UPI003A8A8978
MEAGCGSRCFVSISGQPSAVDQLAVQQWRRGVVVEICPLDSECRLSIILSSVSGISGGGNVPAALLNSSVPRRQLGRELRRLRERLTGVPQTTAARELEWSATKLLRMERGEVPIRAEDVVLLCELYGADLQTIEALAALARRPRRRAGGTTTPASRPGSSCSSVWRRPPPTSANSIRSSSPACCRPASTQLPCSA